jgi:hypothetical protein
MKSLMAGIVLLAVCATAQGAPSTYFGLETADAITWCGYSDKAEFDAAALRQPPDRAAKVSYSPRGELLEIDLQMQDGTGDWRVVDTYTPSRGAVRLVRHYFAGGGEVVQETVIRAGKAAPFRITSGAARTGLASVPASASLDEIPFKAVAAQMHQKSIQRLCRKGGVTVPVPAALAGEAGPGVESYWLVQKEGGTWCGSTHSMEMPAAEVTYASGMVQEIRQTFVQGADWEVLDRYALVGGDWLLRRETVLNQTLQKRHLDVVQVTTIHAGKAGPFRVVSAYDSARPEHGDPTQRPDLSNVDLSPVPVSTQPSGAAFMQVVWEMRDRHLDKLCKRAQ